MEEDIKRIECLIERCNQCKLNACITCDISWSEIQAIDKLYNSNEKQQNRILELEKALIEEDYKHREEIEKLKLLLAETNAQFLNSDLKTKRKNGEDLEMLYKGCQAEIETLKKQI